MSRRAFLLRQCFGRLHDHRIDDMLGPGLIAAGFSVVTAGSDFAAGDVVVLWNRRRGQEHVARLAESRGAHVVVIENGYAGADENGRKLYAMALGHHLGAGRWHVGAERRWLKQGITLSPWREGGRHILVLLQRGIGEAGVAMPISFPRDVVHRLKRLTHRPLRYRKHPGRAPDQPPLEEDLAGAWCAVTWGSGAGIHALIAGVPVFHALKGWVGAPAARPLGHDIEDPFLGDREPMLQRLGWAQWSRREIADGTAFTEVLKAA